MAFKTVLVHVDGSAHLDVRVEAASQIALAQNAHLIGLATTGASRFLFQAAPVNPAGPAVAPYLALLQQRAEDACSRFENIARRVGVASYERRITDLDPADGLSLQGRYCDLVVMGQQDPDESSFTADPNFPGYAILHCGSPALMIPYAARFGTIGHQALVAWNASVEATRAVHSAIPLLQRSKMVDVAIFNPERQAGTLFGDPPGSGIESYLARHHVKADVHRDTTDMDVGDALLSLAAQLGSDLLVMGCYGHSRFRETLLGGATRTMLESMTVPVLMAH
jgi:nucleotide-binding universal stress UspA family protein